MKMLSEYIMRIKKTKPGCLSSREQHDLVNLAKLIAQIALQQETRIPENEDTIDLCQYLKISKKAIALLEHKVNQSVRSEEAFTVFFEGTFVRPKT